MTYDDSFRFRIQLSRARRNLAHRDMDGGGKRRDRDFLGLTNVEYHRALAAATSDLAAMGARPGEAYLVLGLPGGYGTGPKLNRPRSTHRS